MKRDLCGLHLEKLFRALKFTVTRNRVCTSGGGRLKRVEAFTLPKCVAISIFKNRINWLGKSQHHSVSGGVSSIAASMNQ